MSVNANSITDIIIEKIVSVSVLFTVLIIAAWRIIARKGTSKIDDNEQARV